MDIKECIENVWLYSHYYGDMLFTAQRLNDANEGYAAVIILFNAAELIFKSLRENFKENFNQDISALCAAGILSEEEKKFFIDEEYGVHRIRNYMTHRNAYQFCFEAPNGKALPFIEADTWIEIYGNIAPVTMAFLSNAITRTRLQNYGDRQK